MVKLNLSLKPQRIYSEYSGFLAAFFSALVIILLTIFLIKPKIGVILSGRAELEKGQQKLAAMTNKANELQNLSEAELRSKTAKVIVALPNDKDIPGFMATLERLLGESGLGVESIQLTPGLIATSSAKIQTTADKLDFQLSAKGNFEQVKTFLDMLPKTSRVLAVRQVSMSGGGQEEGQTLRVAFQMTFFWQPLPTTLGDVAEPLAVLSSEEEKLYDQVSRFAIFDATTSAQPAGKPDPFAGF